MSDISQQEQRQGDTFGFIRRNIREYGILFALIIIMAFFQIVTGGILFRPVNLTNLFLQNSHIVIMAVGMLLVIVAGHIDLSVGSVAAFVGALAALMIVRYGLPVPLVIVISLVVGGVIGGIQGYWIAYWKIPSFIVTLAGMLVFRGLTMWVLQGQSIGPFPREFQMLASGFIPDIFGADKPNTLSLILGWGAALVILWLQVRNRRREEAVGIADEPFAFFVAKNALIFVALAWMTWALANFRGLPNVFIVMAVLVALYAFLSERTTIGRRIFAIGGNAKAAKLSGINSERVVFLTFMNMGMLAALAGMVVSARLNSATPKAGTGFELDVIAAVFIGGASMAGGVGTVIGAVVGAFIMGVMNNGMSILGIGIDYQQVIKGLVLMAAVIFDVSNKSKS
ncbi:multiple monosaccharide ABC transporter permease [Paracoccus shanxieyensis]|uniref:Xylose transport system permease protein XylH n=1 Tax=Paracoccus shanxieyensis TaxID=2675752 RepID=A0A6L6J1K3_9RHOB|nr:multiple monosaccharide ABC transporter permease [Paracoccus shanxieyensis]MTH65292.1 sugar ABC transporter permease [Paracoccus shanxieyensis]MTH88404.1 sugar ABC transporter permease [Paracoccus shanxieyensis]